MKNNKENLKKLAREWFLKAKDDELSAKDIFRDKEGAPATICFLSQQIAEKYLKGYLIFKGKEFPKIHDLEKLINLSQRLDKEFENLKEDARYLNPFYIATRYPGDYPRVTFEEAEKALKKAIKIKNFVLKKFK